MDLNDTQFKILVALLVFVIPALFVGLPALLGVSIWYAIVPTGVAAAALKISNYRRRRASASG